MRFQIQMYVRDEIRTISIFSYGKNKDMNNVLECIRMYYRQGQINLPY